MTYSEPYGDETGEGWQSIIADTHKRLRHLDPDYTILQIKEKFGTLRYYFAQSKNIDPITWEIMEDVVIAAGLRCSRICEHCGAPGKLRAGGWIKTFAGGWIKTLCDVCANRRNILPETVE
jgi:hypothetical protein